MKCTTSAPTLADTKIRLKPNNDFLISKRADDTQKLAIKIDGGLVLPTYAADVASPEQGECYWSTTDNTIFCATANGEMINLETL